MVFNNGVKIYKPRVIMARVRYISRRRDDSSACGDFGTGHHKVLPNTWTLFQSRRGTKISITHQLFFPKANKEIKMIIFDST